MGCTCEIINFSVNSRETMLELIDLFNSTMIEEFYDLDFKLKRENIKQHENEFWIYIDEEPLFACYECGEQVTDFVKKFIKEHPDNKIFADYHCTFSNCGDATYIRYIYNPESKELEIKSLFGEDSGLYMCPECEEEFEDALMELEDYDPNKRFECPACGAEISLEVSQDIKVVALNDF